MLNVAFLPFFYHSFPLSPKLLLKFLVVSDENHACLTFLLRFLVSADSLLACCTSKVFYYTMVSVIMSRSAVGCNSNFKQRTFYCSGNKKVKPKSQRPKIVSGRQ